MKRTKIEKFSCTCWLILLVALIVSASSCGVDVVQFDESAGSTNPLRILHFSDLHFAGNKDWHDSLISIMEAQKPDLILCTGDIASHEGYLDEIAALLNRMPQVPRFAILGNHEYTSGEDMEDFDRLYASAGFTLLVNQSATVTLKERDVRILGLDDFLHGAPQVSLLGESGFDVVMMHEPEAFTRLSDTWLSDKKRLFFSGHTHGGQITFFGLPLLLPEGSGDFVAGRYEHNKDVLFVSKGLGYTALDLRLFASPDVLVLTL